MIYKTITELKEIKQNGAAEDAAFCSEILISIIKKKPDDFLKKYQNTLSDFIDIYENYKHKQNKSLAEKLENIMTLPAIEIIIILHILQWSKTGKTKVVWPLHHKKYSGLPKFMLPEEIENEMHLYFQSRIQSFPKSAINETVSELVERIRYIGPGVTARPGKISFMTTPYLREPANNLSDNSPIRETYMIKPTQIGWTVMVIENHMLYCVYFGIGPGCFVGGDQTMAEEEIEKRFDEMIYSSNMQNKIKPNIVKKKGKATGDRTDSKSYGGTFLRAVGPNSESKAASFPMIVLWLDEMDKYPFQLTKNGVNSGDIVEKFTRRQDSYRKKGISKTLGGSTPKDQSISRIEPLVEQGDKRYYNIICPKCGLQQPLLWNNFKFRRNDKGKLDIKRKIINGVETIVDDACWYECANKDCDWKMRDRDKMDLLQEKGYGGNAEWIPTKESERPFVRSYVINGLYGFREWWDIAEHFLRVKDDPFKFKDFVTDTLGETWKESANKPDDNELFILSQEHEHWPRGFIKKEILFLTLTADVQKDRLEAGLIGWGRNRQGYVIDYWTWSGQTEAVENDCWERLREKIYTKYIRDDGHELFVQIAFIDTSYLSDTVDLFCGSFDYDPNGIAGVYPAQGRDTQDVIVKKLNSNIKTPVIGFHDQELKRALYNILKKRPHGLSFPGYYLHFSFEYGNEFYKQLTSEEIVQITVKGEQRGFKILNTKKRRNEVLDIVKMGMAAVQWAMTKYFQLKNEQRRLQKRPEIQEDYDLFMDYVENVVD
jgi:phage terminase large subunit GpA-like protein